MATALNCALCQPPELERLIRAEPAVAAQWQTLPRKHFGPGDCLQPAGQPCTRSWLIEQGLVRCFYLAEQGTERNRSFHVEGAWVGGGMPPLVGAEPPQTGHAPSGGSDVHKVTSVGVRTILPSPYSIEALEPTQVVELSYATLQVWHQQFPQIQALLNEAMSCLFAIQSEREADLLSLSAQARYEAFLADQSALAERLPIHHVASYLGISNVSLSRIRARLGLANRGRLA